MVGDKMNYFGIIVVTLQGIIQELTIIYFDNHVPSNL
jgi:hypothetical protein